MLLLVDGYSLKEINLVWENRSDEGIAIPPQVRDLPQHNITETVTLALQSTYVFGKLLDNATHYNCYYSHHSHYRHNYWMTFCL